jgi:hypothetical protein
MSAPTLISGDVIEVDALATQLGHVAFETRYTATQLERLHTDTWVGRAADAFGRQAGELPPKLHRAADAFDAAESAYRAFNRDLAAAQEQARRAMGMWAAAEGDTASWRARIDALPADDPARVTPDPGAPLRGQASAMYGEAVALVDASARRAAAALHEAAATAPHGPGFWSKAWHETCEFADGVWDGTVGLVKFAWEFSPIRAALDPDGFTRDAEQMGEALWWGVQHPVDFAKAVGHEWAEHPAHAIGELVPGLLLAAATGGTGLAATAVREGVQATADVATSIATRLATRVRELDLASDTGSASIDLLTLGIVHSQAIAELPVSIVADVIESASSTRFVRQAGPTFTTRAALEYRPAAPTAHNHRLLHVLAHSVEDTSKPTHTVFKDGIRIFDVIDEAWTRRLAHGQVDLDGRVWDIGMGRVVGTNGERTVRIVLKRNTTCVITACLVP